MVAFRTEVAQTKRIGFALTYGVFLQSSRPAKPN
jgi:hypothetical protein